MAIIELAESGLAPDAIVRLGIRQLISRTANRITSSDARQRAREIEAFVEDLRESPIALATELANQQHYEVPSSFFEAVLGPRLKYSACLFPTPETSLAEAEEFMLRETCSRAGVENGMRILDLGCGWGSLALWMAEHYPQCEIVAVSNSTTQRDFIQHRAAESDMRNLQVITADMREYAARQKFDRIVSVEMLEHMRNYELVFRRMASWLQPAGKVFIHIFCHQSTPYLFETRGASNWMGRNFFTGGMMPAEDLFQRFDDDLQIVKQWRIDGLHYWRTCEAWLANLDRNRDQILTTFRQRLSAADARTALQRWRMFFMACAELFRYHQGNEWFVAHYLMTPSGTDSGHQQPCLQQTSS